MKAEKKSGLVPKLRFPEFREAGEWEFRNLGRVAENLDNRRVPITSGDRVAGMIPYYGASGVVDYVKGFIFDEDLLCVSEDGANLVARTYPIAFPISGKTWVNNHAHVLRFQNLFTQKFVEVYLNSIKLDDFITGMAQPKLNKTMLDSIPIPWPTVPEQQRIADCLASLDELITLEAQKLDTLKTHKKGLMQQLFPAEGETLPKLRFPEFREAGEWEEMQIGDLKPFVTSGSRGWAAYYANQGSLFVRITNLTRESIYLDLADTKFVKLPQEASEGVRTQLKEHDVLISITADIGIIGYVDASISSPAYINQHIALVRFDSSQVCSKFVSYFLASERSQRLFRASTDIGTKAGMSLIMVQKIQVVLPTLPEQQKIADCLTSLDDLIIAQSQKLAALKTHKKGLMQQLFPALEEVTA
ncbi:restriction endonuclease subunit S [Trichlorobacter ammonificans]|uniref:Type I restriction-modification system, specificity subunit S n=1 Tax=Trichlorobacter ammonificans TaxID=2916410 RepID=A0ABM9D885_9BACT|nr:restriction endonuclease subunit S [Trichlorobacter ammonificans]CAH2031282.1 Type I restriction-modification system, specificity subunit S [Trichlorobacter ammonificans]